MTSINQGLFSSTSEEWATPKMLFEALDAEFAFNLDPAASTVNAKVAQYFTAADDGLSRPWRGSVFVNPPYGRQLGRWLSKAYDESRQGATVVCLIAARTDTAHWHESVMRASEIRFIRGRLRFDSTRSKPIGTNQANSAPFPSCVVVFRPGPDKLPLISSIGRDGSRLAIDTLGSAQQRRAG